MVPPGLPTPWSKRRRTLRWLRSLARSFNLWGLAALLLAGAVLWVVTSMPLDQTVEGTVVTSAISFALGEPTENVATDQATGFLEADVRNVVISGLRAGAPATFALKGTPLRVENYDKVEFKPWASETFAVALRLPPGTRVENLKGEDQQELVVGLRSPTGNRRSPPMPIDLSITPPASQESSRGEPGQGEPVEIRSGLRAVHMPASQPERDLPTPDGTFPLLLQGDVLLRLQLADPSIVFEPKLPVREVKFYTIKASVFEGPDLRLSNVLKGNLHFGRREPLELREKQFLKIESPGILELTDLRLDKNELIVSVSGQTNQLSVGLSPDRASTQLKGTILSRHLSPEQISGFYGFMGGLIGSMILLFFRAD
jgi:hypothetical protein